MSSETHISRGSIKVHEVHESHACRWDVFLCLAPIFSDLRASESCAAQVTLVGKPTPISLANEGPLTTANFAWYFPGSSSTRISYGVRRLSFSIPPTWHPRMTWIGSTRHEHQQSHENMWEPCVYGRWWISGCELMWVTCVSLLCLNAVPDIRTMGLYIILYYIYIYIYRHIILYRCIMMHI